MRHFGLNDFIMGQYKVWRLIYPSNPVYQSIPYANVANLNYLHIMYFRSYAGKASHFVFCELSSFQPP